MDQNNKNIIPANHLLAGYKSGIFPMSSSRNDSGFEWFTAGKRGIIPMDRFRVSGNVKRLIRQGKYNVGVDKNFRAVMEGCANRKTTWISDIIIRSYCNLNKLGYAHSVEIYDEQNQLSGGLYGVSVGAAFFGESMFKKEKEADKIALWHCHQILEKNGFQLWDTQFYTEHLSQFGCIEISQNKYNTLLKEALEKNARFRFDETTQYKKL